MSRRARIAACMLLGALALLWAWRVIAFSLQPGSQSQALSTGVCERVARLFSRDYDALSDDGKLALQRIVRKTGHFCEYALFGAIAALITAAARRRRSAAALWPAWAVGTLLGVCDELVQLSVPGRSGRVLDMCIDSAGALAGAVFVWALLTSIASAKARRQPANT